MTHYPPVPGYPELRKAVCERLKKALNVDYDFSQVVVSAGGKHSLANVVLSIIDRGDEVIVPAPYWVSYVEMVTLAEGKNVIVSAGIDQDFKITPAQLEAAITPKTKMLILNSPSNPTGSMYTAEELEGLAAVLRRHPQVYVLSDEIYDMITYGQEHVSMAQIPDMKDRVILCNGLSKGYAMTGWRVGYIAAPLEIAKACIKLQGQFTSGVNTIAEFASIAALRESDEPSRKMTEQFKARRDMMIELLADVPGLKLRVPPGAFYLILVVTTSGVSGRIGSHGEVVAVFKGHIASPKGTWRRCRARPSASKDTSACRMRQARTNSVRQSETSSEHWLS